MVKNLASVVSYIFNPLVFPTLGLLVIIFNFKFGFSPNFKKVLIMLVFSGTFLLPALLFPILKHYKLIDNFDITDKKDRLLPLIIVFFSYFVTYMALKKLGMPSIILLCILSPIFSLMLSFIITIFWKISIHMLGIGGFSGMIIALFGYFNPSITTYLFSSIILCSGLLGTARLILKMHTPTQVYLGYFTGLITVFLFFSIFIQ